jgi:BMFP domain-containing protein YqiC
MAAAARGENERLARRVAELEAALAAKSRRRRAGTASGEETAGEG